MRSSMSALSLALAVAAAGFPAAAGAQQPQQEATAAQPQAPAILPSKKAHKPLLELQQAVDAKDLATIPAKLAAAEAAATTPEDRYLIAGQRYLIAVAAKHDSARAAALEALVASGKVDAAKLPVIYLELGTIAYNGKQLDKAAANFEKALAASPANSDALVMLAETRHAQGKGGEAVDLFKRAIGQVKATGQKPKEEWYRRALGIAYGAKRPDSVELARDWVKAYPSKESWRDSIRIYRKLQDPPQAILVDLLRLARATGALEGPADVQPYAYAAIDELAPGEAMAVVKESIAAGHIEANDAHFRDILAEVEKSSAGQKERLPALTKDALKSPSAKMAMTAGNILYGYGDFAKAAELYRAALDKSGADKDLVNLRLGMSLARSGDKVGAAAALQAVTGTRSEVAKYWLAYLQTLA